MSLVSHAHRIRLLASLLRCVPNSSAYLILNEGVSPEHKEGTVERTGASEPNLGWYLGTPFWDSGRHQTTLPVFRRPHHQCLPRHDWHAPPAAPFGLSFGRRLVRLSFPSPLPFPSSRTSNTCGPRGGDLRPLPPPPQPAPSLSACG